jgi:hypothetical protein
VDGDGYAARDDCDDHDVDAYPGAFEVCDGVDNDCDGDSDEGVTTTWYRDADGDNYGDPDTTEQACASSDGWVQNGEDCDDGDPGVAPGVNEVCDDGVDNDCDGLTDSEDEAC